jgi:flagellum-specific ATP synthase
MSNPISAAVGIGSSLLGASSSRRAASAQENELIGRARQLLGAWDRSEMMIAAGLYSAGSDPMVDAAISVWADLDRFLAADAPENGVEGSFAALEKVLKGAEK